MASACWVTREGRALHALTVFDIQGRAVRKPFDFEYVRRNAEQALSAQLRRKEVTLLLGHYPSYVARSDASGGVFGHCPSTGPAET